MHGLRNAQRTYDRRLPDDGWQRGEREFAHPEFAPAGTNVIRSSKFIEEANMSRYQVKQSGKYALIVDTRFDDSPLYRYDANAEGFEQAEAKCESMNRFIERKEADKTREAA